MFLPWQIPSLIIANRMRDGWITELTKNQRNPILLAIWTFFTKYSQEGRLILWALPFAATVFFTNHPSNIYNSIWYGLALLCTAFIGACLPAWGKYDIAPINWPMLALNGFLFVAPVAAICAAFGYLKLSAFIVISGLTISPSYYIGWKIPGTWNGTPWGSFIFGALIGIFIFLGALIIKYFPIGE